MPVEIGDQISYAEEHTILGESVYWTVWRPGWILKIAKTGNFYIGYETERPYRGGWGSTDYCYRKRWVRPMGADHHVFPAVEDLPPKPFKPKEIIKSCKNCQCQPGYINYSCDGCKDFSKWSEFIGYDDGSIYINKSSLTTPGTENKQKT